jgi:hypothetical protein
MMRDPDQGHALSLELPQAGRQRSARGSIQRGGRLVQRQALRRDQGMNQVDLLLLANRGG